MNDSEPELSWRDVLTFLQDEVNTGEAKGYPTLLVNMVDALLTSARIIYKLVTHLQDPENRYHKICLQCGKEFYHTNQFVRTCTQKCHRKWLVDPHGYMSDKSNIRSTLTIMQQLEHPEKA